MTQDMIIGVDVGGTQLRAVLADSAGKIQKRIAVPTNSFEGRDAVLNRIRQLIRDVCKTCEWDQIRGIGIGVPGPTDPFAGLVIIAPNIPGWLNVDLLGELTPFFDCPIYVGNDANLAGLAEHRFGAGQGVAHMIFLTVSTGVGGGIIVDNRMLLGQRGFGAEVGHMTIEARHAPNAEGILGTLEDLAAGPGIARRAKAALRKGATSSLLSTVNGDIDAITPKMITEAAHAGDPFRHRTFPADRLLSGRGHHQPAPHLQPGAHRDRRQRLAQRRGLAGRPRVGHHPQPGQVAGVLSEAGNCLRGPGG